MLLSLLATQYFFWWQVPILVPQSKPTTSSDAKSPAIEMPSPQYYYHLLKSHYSDNKSSHSVCPVPLLGYNYSHYYPTILLLPVVNNTQEIQVPLLQVFKSQYYSHYLLPLMSSPNSAHCNPCWCQVTVLNTTPTRPVRQVPLLSLTPWCQVPLLDNRLIRCYYSHYSVFRVPN